MDPEYRDTVQIRSEEWPAQLHQSLKQLQQDDSLCDVTIRGKNGQEFNVHSAVVGAASAKLASLLSKRMQVKIVLDTQVDDSIWDLILQFIYNSQAQLSAKLLPELRSIADGLNLSSLVEACLFGSLENAVQGVNRSWATDSEANNDAESTTTAQRRDSEECPVSSPDADLLNIDVHQVKKELDPLSEWEVADVLDFPVSDGVDSDQIETTPEPDTDFQCSNSDGGVSIDSFMNSLVPTSLYESREFTENEDDYFNVSIEVETPPDRILQLNQKRGRGRPRGRPPKKSRPDECGLQTQKACERSKRLYVSRKQVPRKGQNRFRRGPGRPRKYGPPKKGRGRPSKQLSTALQYLRQKSTQKQDALKLFNLVDQAHKKRRRGRPRKETRPVEGFGLSQRQKRPSEDYLEQYSTDTTTLDQTEYILKPSPQRRHIPDVEPQTFGMVDHSIPSWSLGNSKQSPSKRGRGRPRKQCRSSDSVELSRLQSMDDADLTETEDRSISTPKQPSVLIVASTPLSDISPQKRRPGRPRKQLSSNETIGLSGQQSIENDVSTEAGDRSNSAPKQRNALTVASTPLSDISPQKRRPGRPRKQSRSSDSVELSGLQSIDDADLTEAEDHSISTPKQPNDLTSTSTPLSDKFPHKRGPGRPRNQTQDGEQLVEENNGGSSPVSPQKRGRGRPRNQTQDGEQLVEENNGGSSPVSPHKRGRGRPRNQTQDGEQLVEENNVASSPVSPQKRGRGRPRNQTQDGEQLVEENNGGSSPVSPQKRGPGGLRKQSMQSEIIRLPGQLSLDHAAYAETEGISSSTAKQRKLTVTSTPLSDKFPHKRGRWRLRNQTQDGEQLVEENNGGSSPVSGDGIWQRSNNGSTGRPRKRVNIDSFSKETTFSELFSESAKRGRGRPKGSFKRSILLGSCYNRKRGHRGTLRTQPQRLNAEIEPSGELPTENSQKGPGVLNGSGRGLGCPRKKLGSGYPLKVSYGKKRCRPIRTSKKIKTAVLRDGYLTRKRRGRPKGSRNQFCLSRSLTQSTQFVNYTPNMQIIRKPDAIWGTLQKKSSQNENAENFTVEDYISDQISRSDNVDGNNIKSVLRPRKTSSEMVFYLGGQSNNTGKPQSKLFSMLKRGPGRPKGSFKKKLKLESSSLGITEPGLVSVQKRGPGRPKGASKNKFRLDYKVCGDLADREVTYFPKRGCGRPRGSFKYKYQSADQIILADKWRVFKRLSEDVPKISLFNMAVDSSVDSSNFETVSINKESEASLAAMRNCYVSLTPCPKIIELESKKRCSRAKYIENDNEDQDSNIKSDRKAKIIAQVKLVADSINMQNYDPLDEYGINRSLQQLHVSSEESHTRFKGFRRRGRPPGSLSNSTKRGRPKSKDIIQDVHMKMNSSNCIICGQTVPDRVYREHQLRHANERPFSCSICSETFRMLGSCRRHEQNHFADIQNNGFLEHGLAPMESSNTSSNFPNPYIESTSIERKVAVTSSIDRIENHLMAPPVINDSPLTCSILETRSLRDEILEGSNEAIGQNSTQIQLERLGRPNVKVEMN